MLKTDLHIHTNVDPQDSFIKYSSRDLIDIASKNGYDVLSITNHNDVFSDKAVSAYAKRKGILLIPGAELTIDRRHVLVYGITNADLKKIKTMDDLGKAPFVIAPHPFYKARSCLGNRLVEHQRRFDAIEYAHFHMGHVLNFNKKAMRLANDLRIPMVGNSDAHYMMQFGKTYSLIDAEKKMDDIFEAIRKFKVKIVSNPLTPIEYTRVMLRSILLSPFGRITRRFRNL